MTTPTKTMAEWKVIDGYPNYLINRLGVIKSIKPGTKYKSHLKPSNCGSGYPSVCLVNESGNKTQTVHRLVAKAFIPNPLNKRTVNHINGKKGDNRAENLEWLTHGENNKHSYDIGLSDHLRDLSRKRFKKVLYLGSKSRRKKVICTKTGKIFQSLTTASRYSGISKSCLSNKLSGRHKNNTSFVLYDEK